MGLKDVVLSINPAITVGASQDVQEFHVIGSPAGSTGVVYACISDEVFTERRVFTAKARMPQLDPKTRTYNKGKVSLSIASPLQLADGTIVFNDARVEFGIHPLADANTLPWLKNMVVQLVASAEAEDFWKFGLTNS